MSSRIAFLVKILAITLLLFGGYYLFFLRPKLELTNSLIQAEKTLGGQMFNLTQNRVAYLELTHLEPKGGNFNLEKSNLVGTLQKTIKEGRDSLAGGVKIPNIDPKLTERFPTLLEETKTFYERQDKLLKKVFETKSYPEGVALMKSQEAVDLLTKQTNLILESQFWLDKINKLQGEEK